MDDRDPNKKPKGFLVPIWRDALRAMSLGWDLAVPIFGGVLIGYFLDRHFETDRG